MNAYRKITNYLFFYKHNHLTLMDDLIKTDHDQPNGGYTSLVKVGSRKGDGAAMGYLVMNSSYSFLYKSSKTIDKSKTKDDLASSDLKRSAAKHDAQVIDQPTAKDISDELDVDKDALKLKDKTTKVSDETQSQQDNQQDVVDKKATEKSSVDKSL